MTDVTLHLLDDGGSTDVAARIVDTEVLLSAAAVLAATGWEVKPHGLCRGEVCIPVRFADDISLRALAEALHRPLAVEVFADQAVAVLGAPGETTVHVGDVVPDVVLPDVDGNPVALTGAGRKTVVVAWSTWCGCRYELPAWLQLAQELDGEVDVVTVALDEDVPAVRKWTSRVEGLTVAIDAEHRLSDVFGIVNVPSTVWIDEDGHVAKAPTIAPGDDRFVEFTEVSAEVHHEALRAWARDGTVAQSTTVEATDDLRAARAERRLAAWLLRNGHDEAAERHFAAAVALAPLDFSIRRASMPLRGQDPFGADFFELWKQWSDAGRPGYAATAAPGTMDR